MRYNPARQEVVLKVVYCGPGLAGKTSNLTFLQSHAPAGSASPIASVDHNSERTLQFDMLASALGKIQGLAVRLEFATVPGQSYYAATRRHILTGADGVVFVADSRREALDENIDAMNEMLGNLRHHGLGDDLPLVVQYNKQDLPTAVKPEQLQPLMNIRGWPSFAASASTGAGVSETCEALVRLLVDRLANTQLPLLPGAPAGGAPAPAPGPDGNGDPAIIPPRLRTPVPAEPKSWLITCFRCQSMLDVPSATPGESYTCGVCHTPLEVVDPDRGTTRSPAPPPPAAIPRPVTGQYQAPPPSQQRPSANLDEDLNAGGEAPLRRHHTGTFAPSPPAGGPGVVPAAVGVAAGDFPLPGFTVLSTIDENVQGRRLRVRETASGKTYRALVLSPGLLAQPGYRETVEPYSRMTGPIRHPNLLQLHSFRQAADGTPVFLSADPQDHESLAHVLSRRRALAPPHALGILRQIALALEEGARHGAIHGWLRPDVVLVSPDGVVLLDELCVPSNHRFITRELAGASAATEYYLAPEYLNDDLRGDVRSDVFLLGALLFRMLTGEGLVTGYNAMEALHKIAANGPRVLRDAQQGVSRELNAFFLRLAAVDRNERFQTYGELIDQLDRFGGGAKRQNLQLTVPQARGAGGGIPRPITTSVRVGGGSSTRPISGGVQSGRRSVTGPLPQAPRRDPSGANRRLSDPSGANRRLSDPSGGHRRLSDPSGGHRVLPPPPPRRPPPSNNGPVVIVILVLLMLAAVVVTVMMLQPRPMAVVNDPPAPPPPMAPKPKPATPAPPTTPAPAPTGYVPSSLTPLPASAATGGVSPAAAAAASEKDKTRSELRRMVADLLQAERFTNALAASERFTDAQDKRDAQSDVLARHDARKREIEGLLKPGLDMDALVAVLAPARNVWGLPGDLEWAVAVKSKADTIALSSPAADPVAPAAGGVADPMAGTPLAARGATGPAGATAATPAARPDYPPVKDPASDAYGTLLRAFAANQPAQAQAAVAPLDAAAPTTPALRQAVAWWPLRSQLINRVAGTRAVKLRFSHPTTNELVDVSAADANGVTVTAASGSGSTLTWGQLPPRVQAKLAADASAAAGTSADELGAAVLVQLVAEDQAMAGLLARRGKAQLGDKAEPVERLIELHAHHGAVVVLDKGFAAARAGDHRGAADALAEARRLDKGALKGLDGELARLEQATVAPAPAPVAAAPLTAGQQFAERNGPPADLRERQEALRTLGWEPSGNAWLEGTAVRMTANAAISFELTRAVNGFTIEASGDGYLRLLALKGAPGPSPKGGIPLPLNSERPVAYTVTFARDGMNVLDGRGTVIQTLPLSAAPTLFLIISTADATLLTVPKPLIQ